MEIIISKDQYSLLKEMHVFSGKFNPNPISSFFYLLNNDKKFDEKKIIKYIRKYFQNVVGIDTLKYSDDSILYYLNDLTVGIKGKHIPSPFYRSGVVSGLSYHLAKNFFKLKESKYGLSYIVSNEFGNDSYYFFDSEIKDFIGRIVVEPFTGLGNNAYSVVMSATDPAFLGKGYGSKMYLILIDKFEYLRSDTSLYRESLNIWSNFLPKHVNVWGYIDGQFEKITPRKFIPPTNIAYYVASSRNNTIY